MRYRFSSKTKFFWLLIISNFLLISSLRYITTLQKKNFLLICTPIKLWISFLESKAIFSRFSMSHSSLAFDFISSSSSFWSFNNLSWKCIKFFLVSSLFFLCCFTFDVIIRINFVCAIIPFYESKDCFNIWSTFKSWRVFSEVDILLFVLPISLQTPLRFFCIWLCSFRMRFISESSSSIRVLCE